MAIRPIDADELKNQIKHMPRTVNPDLVQYKLVQAIIADMPTLTPPNEPLTLDELREMDGEPVWVELYQAWALVEVKQNGSVMFYGNSFSCSYSRTWQVYRFRPYRRPPEGEEDTCE